MTSYSVFGRLVTQFLHFTSNVFYNKTLLLSSLFY